MTRRAPTAPTTETVESIDGRTMRRNRNRAAVISALLTMIREGDLHPGAAEIAQRAGVSHRSIFRYFDDLDDLVRTAIDQAFTEAERLTAVPDAGHDLAARAAAIVDARIALYEYVDGPMQVARMRAGSIPAIDEELALIAEQFRRQIADHFTPEMARSGADARGHLIDGVLVLTSYDSYALHVRLLRHDADTIRSGWSTALLALLDS
jgi:TetR/AcrR family transcriptional regulator of autoinduction and epiphytic fitness